jgi:hypothetical protein
MEGASALRICPRPCSLIEKQVNKRSRRVRKDLREALNFEKRSEKVFNADLGGSSK